MGYNVQLNEDNVSDNANGKMTLGRPVTRDDSMLNRRQSLVPDNTECSPGQMCTTQEEAHHS